MNLESAYLLASGFSFSLISHTVRTVLGRKMAQFEIEYINGLHKNKSATKIFSKCVKYLPIVDESVPVGIVAFGLITMILSTVAQDPHLVLIASGPTLTHTIELARKKYLKFKYKL